MRLLPILLFVITVGLCCGEEFPDVPDFSDLTIIKTRCEKKGSPESFEKIKQAKDEVVPCVKNIINVDTVKSEVEEAKKTGSMDEVFGKYCKKRDDIKKCVDKMINATRPCLEEDETQALDVTLEILKELGEFACYRDGDRIAMFVAEGGMECIKSHVDGIKNCFNATLKINPENISFNSIPNLSITKEKCNKINTVQTCVVEELEKCKDSTPANIVDALFKFVKKSACKNNKQRRSLPPTGVFNSNLKSIVTSKMEWYCTQYGPTGAWPALRDSYVRFEECFKTHPNPKDLKNVCYTDVAEKIRVCLPETLKYYPDFMLNLTDSFKGLYNKYTKQIQLGNPENAVYFNCFTQLRSSPQPVECFTKSSVASDPVPIDEFCRGLQGIAQCFENTVKSICVRDIKIDALLQDFVQTVLKSCRGVDTSGVSPN